MTKKAAGYIMPGIFDKFSLCLGSVGERERHRPRSRCEEYTPLQPRAAKLIADHPRTDIVTSSGTGTAAPAAFFYSLLPRRKRRSPLRIEGERSFHGSMKREVFLE